MDLDITESQLANNGNGSTNENHNNSGTNGTTQALSKHGYDADVVRLIGQHLVDLGLKQTVDLLFEESGLNELDNPVASKLQRHILAGEWDNADGLVEELATHSKGDRRATISEMRLLIAEQKFLELLEQSQHMKALKCLRLEITPLMQDVKKIQQLATLLMCKSTEGIRLSANWPGKGIESRQKLIEKFQQFVPPSVMLPPRRLKTLLSQAIQLQQDRCPMHIPSIKQEHIDLKSDHLCSSESFPLCSRQELDDHKTEVWFCKFSNDGTKLATAGLGGKIKIWDVDPNSRLLTERCTLDCSCFSITCLSWSPNDIYLLACGSEEKPDLWIWNVNKKEIHNNISHTDDESTTTCSWHLSGEKFAVASIKGNFNIYDINGNRQGSREGVRVQCLSFLHEDPEVILAADTLNRIKSYAIKDMSLETYEEDVLEEQHSIMSFTIDKDDRYIAVNIMEQGVHLWDYRLKTLLRMFPGVMQRNFTIYSSFSSPDSRFVASGSEDGKVYIYHIDREKPIAILHGHSRCVNCVSWNPKHPELLVSVSDDRSIILWAPNNDDTSRNDPISR